MKSYMKYTLVGALALSQGCTMIAKKSWDDARTRSAVRVEADGQQVLVGVDLLSLDYLKDNWKVAVPAAIVDGFVLYKGVTWLEEKINGDGGDSNKPDPNAPGSTNASIVNSPGASITNQGGMNNSQDNSQTSAAPAPAPVIPSP
jgi:hypothetical protein